VFGWIVYCPLLYAVEELGYHYARDGLVRKWWMNWEKVVLAWPAVMAVAGLASLN